MKRTDYINWDEYFMGIAMLAAKRSKDPNTQVGACIVSQDNIIISTGYNGMPKGCSDDEYPWDRVGEETKYPYVVHAELNAVLNANGRDLRGSKLYGSVLSFRQVCRLHEHAGFQADDDVRRREVHPAAHGTERDHPGLCARGRKIMPDRRMFLSDPQIQQKG